MVFRAARSTWRLLWALYSISKIRGGALVGAGSINWLKLFLTYRVPYLVSTYGAVSYRLKATWSGDIHKETFDVPRN